MEVSPLVQQARPSFQPKIAQLYEDLFQVSGQILVMLGKSLKNLSRMMEMANLKASGASSFYSGPTGRVSRNVWMVWTPTTSYIFR